MRRGDMRTSIWRRYCWCRRIPCSASRPLLVSRLVLSIVLHRRVLLDSVPLQCSSAVGCAGDDVIIYGRAAVHGNRTLSAHDRTECYWLKYTLSERSEVQVTGYSAQEQHRVRPLGGLTAEAPGLGWAASEEGKVAPLCPLPPPHCTSHAAPEIGRPLLTLSQHQGHYREIFSRFPVALLIHMHKVATAADYVDDPRTVTKACTQ